MARFIRVRVRSSLSGDSSGFFFRIERKHSSRISLVHLTWTRPVIPTRTSRSRSGAG